MMTNAERTLYARPLSGNAHKVRLLLGFLKLPYQEIALAPQGGIGIDAYPNVTRWVARLKALPGFTTMPGM